MELLFVTLALTGLAFAGAAAGPLAKALSHKYLKRVPYTTRDGKRKYRYWYKLPGGGMVDKDHLAVGSAFKVEGGHYHVTAVDEGKGGAGGKVTVRHDETKKEATLSHDALAALLHEEHKGKIAERGERLRRTLAEAEAVGNKKLVAARRKEVEAHAAAYEGGKGKPEGKPEAAGKPKAEGKGKAEGKPAAAADGMRPAANVSFATGRGARAAHIATVKRMIQEVPERRSDRIEKVLRERPHREVIGLAVRAARRALDRERAAGRESDPRIWAGVDVADRYAAGEDVPADEMRSAADAAHFAVPPRVGGGISWELPDSIYEAGRSAGLAIYAASNEADAPRAAASALAYAELGYQDAAEQERQDAEINAPRRVSPDQITADEQQQREEAARKSADKRRKPEEAPKAKPGGDGGDAPAPIQNGVVKLHSTSQAPGYYVRGAVLHGKDGNDYVVTGSKAKYISQDGMSQGLPSEDGWIHEIYVKPAPPDAVARAKNMEGWNPSIKWRVSENPDAPARVSPDQITADEQQQREEAARKSADKRRKDSPSAPKADAPAARAAVAAAHAVATPETFAKPTRRTARSTARRLQEPISKATGAAPAEARAFVAETLGKAKWQPEGRAALVGAALGTDGAHVVANRRTLSQGAESLGGFAPGAADVVEAVDLHKGAESGKVAKEADPALALLAAALRSAESDPEAAAGALRKLLSSPALDRVARMALAYPGVDADRTVAAVPTLVAKAEAAIPHAPRTEGAARTVYFPGPGGKPVGLPGKYRLLTVADAVTSHDASTFAVNKAYPEGWQTRVYHTDKGEQDKVNRNVDNMIPSFTVNTNPDGVNGPPVMLANGVVMGGNSRTMSIRKAYDTGHKNAEAYRTYLRENAAQFGFSPEDVDAVKNPILVREVDTGAMGPAEMKLFVQNLNEGFTQSMDPRTMAVAMSRKVSERALETLASELDDDETLSDFLASPRSTAFIDGLYSGGIIDDRNESAYIRKGTRRVNEQGKALVESILVGKMIGDPDVLRDARPSIVTSLARAVPHMIRATAGGDGYDLREPLRHALSAYNEFARLSDTRAIKALPDAKWKPEEIDKFIDNALTGRIVEDHPAATDPRARAILTAMFTHGGSVQMSKVFKKYADMAKRNPENQEASEVLAGKRKTPAEVFRIAIQGAADEPEPKQEGFGFAHGAGELYSGAALLRAFAARRPRPPARW